MNKTIPIKLPTAIDYYGEIHSNQIYIKRDDLTDIAFGGNKARKLQYFIQEALSKNADSIVTYGAIQSNHCRITSAVATMKGLDVYLIQPESKEHEKFNGNKLLNSFFEPKIITAPVENIFETIDSTLNQLKSIGKNPYFIQGGGHGDLGTHAYKTAYDEIVQQEKELNIQFDSIFHASGTGTTQAGLIAGKVMNDKDTNIYGISVARNAQRGTEVIKASLLSYLKSYNYYEINNSPINFIDDYIGKGYADVYPEIIQTIKEVVRKSSVFLDPVYTGKAFYGMKEHIKRNNIKNEDILFIHTGGTPILFNYAEEIKKELL